MDPGFGRPQVTTTGHMRIDDDNDDDDDDDGDDGKSASIHQNTRDRFSDLYRQAAEMMDDGHGSAHPASHPPSPTESHA